MMDRKVSGDAFFWALQGVCALHRKPFSDALARQQLAAPYTTRSLQDALQAYGFDAVHHKAKADKLHKETFPLIAWLQPKAENPTAAQASGEAPQVSSPSSSA
jgi:ATP-binding cassette, subfamily B, bacterial HlyB/CyaB